MCDLAYVNLLREKVRQLEAEEKRLQDFGRRSSPRFVPYILPAQSATPVYQSHRLTGATDRG
jgi:hypothetical protein